MNKCQINEEFAARIAEALIHANESVKGWTVEQLREATEEGLKIAQIKTRDFQNK